MAQLAGLQGGMEGGGVQVDGEFKEGTLHLNVDSHDFHEVITGGTVYVPPDLAAQQEAYYARKAEAAGNPKEAGVKQQLDPAAVKPVAVVKPVVPRVTQCAYTSRSRDARAQDEEETGQKPQCSCGTCSSCSSCSSCHHHRGRGCCCW